jgi:acyl-CoA synthetase (AMP-forming)/AMP-acid ligase II
MTEAQEFWTLSDRIAAHARQCPGRRAIVHGARTLTYFELDALLSRFAAGLARDGIEQRSAVAIVSATTLEMALAFLGALRAGCVVAPIAPSSTPEQIAAMVADCRAAIVFVDADTAALLPPTSAQVVRLDALESWLPPESTAPIPVTIAPDDAFNIIYSSGTTGTPKGIVHTHAMRWMQVAGFGDGSLADAVTMVATPLYSNTTLSSFLPMVAFAGTIIILTKFDARQFLEVAERERATHVMLVPVQYQRIMALPDFDRFDLTSFRLKACTSAPFAAELKADVVRRWPGLLVEIYGMTEGGGTCVLVANAFPNKLHTVGQPAPGADLRLIDEHGREVAQGEIGEVVGRSRAMMAGYHGRADATRAAQWFDEQGNCFIRHGDLGRFDADGFLTLLGRSKDMIISGGFNIYPPDIEAVLLEHPGVADCAVIGVASEKWGETPYAFYVPKGEGGPPNELVAWVNARVGKTQRLSGAEAIAELPRSPIGKVLKRELRERHRR